MDEHQSEWLIRIFLFITLLVSLLHLISPLLHANSPSYKLLFMPCLTLGLLLLVRSLSFRTRVIGAVLCNYYIAGILSTHSSTQDQAQLYLLVLPPFCATLMGAHWGLLTALLSLFIYTVATLIPLTRISSHGVLLMQPIQVQPLATFTTLLTLATAPALVIVRSQRAASVRTYRRLLTTRETQRKQIARDLHDTTLQQLLLIRRRLSYAPGPYADLIPLLDQTVQGLRQIIEAQYSPLIDLGIPSALEGLIAEMQKWAGPSPQIIWRSTIHEPLPLTKEQCTALYRITQELLTNAIKHANAQQILITLERQGNSLRLSVIDDGIGITPEAFDNAQVHPPFMALYEWATALDASLQIEARDPKAANKGTCVTVQFTFSPKGDD